MTRKRILIAGYGLPAEYAIAILLGEGWLVADIALLTYPEDDRNAGLFRMAKLRGIQTSVAAARSDEAYRWVTGFSPDLILSLHYRDMIPTRILELAPLGGANLHPSLLPKYRGTNSIPWAIIHGEEEIGFTFHRLTSSFDTGAILIQEKTQISFVDTAFALFHRMITMAMPHVIPVVRKLVDEMPGTPQPPGGSYFKRETPFGGRIDPTWDHATVDRFIRAMYFPPFKPAVLDLDGHEIEITSLRQYLEVRGVAAK